MPFEKLVEALQPARSLSHAPLFQVLLALQNAPAPALELPGLRLERLESDQEAAKFDLHLTLSEDAAGGGWTGSLGYASDLFDAATAGRFAGHLRVLLAAAVARPAESWRDLPLLTAGEREQLLADAAEPADATVDGAEGTLAGLFAAQAARTPDAVALVAGSQRLTYAELADAPPSSPATSASWGSDPRSGWRSAPSGRST